MKDLAGRTAIITGGGSGIGRGTALALARRGVNVVVAEIDGDRAAGTAAQVAEEGGCALGLAFNVVDGSFEALNDQVVERFGGVDIVMNNVGGMTNGLPDQIPLDEWRRSFELNLMPLIKSNQVFIPRMIAQGHGHIINTASFAGLYTYAFDRMPYAAFKAAVVQMSEGMALYLRPQGIGVSLLCPGPIMTDMMASTRYFGERVQVRTPGAQFGLKQADEVGEQVVEAILADRFMVPTHPEVRDVLVARASDWDGFLQDQIDRPSFIPGS